MTSGTCWLPAFGEVPRISARHDVQMLDPARWPTRLQFSILVVLVLVTGIIWFIGTPTTIGPILTAWLVLAPAVVGAFLWRFEHIPWPVILSWTAPLTAWIAGSLVLVHAPVRWVVAYTPAGLWLATFIFWTPRPGGGTGRRWHA